MKKILRVADGAAGIPAAKTTATPSAAPATAAPAPVMVDIAAKITQVTALIDELKKHSQQTGQLQVAIGGLGTFLEFAQSHLKLIPTPAATATAATTAPATEPKK